MTQNRTIKLNLFMLASGHHHGAWRHPDVPRDQDLELSHFAALAKIAERGKFDALFLQDLVGVRESLGREAMRHGDHGVVQLDPLLVLASIAAVTERIGLIATSSTTYNQPFQVARKFSSLDHLSGGRAGWNIVTSTDEEEAQNFSFNETVAHDERYRRAEEFVDVVRGLWDSWEDGAFPRDKKSGVYLESDKMHHLNHHGKYFKVRGPLNIPRSPQGHPVLVQAGSSAAGQDLSARVADIVFTVNPTLSIAQEFYASFKKLVQTKGRDPNSVVVMPGIFPVIADTEEKARKKFNELQDLVHPAFGVGILGKMIGNFDLTQYPLDGPLPDLPVTDEQQGRQRSLMKLAKDQNLSIRQLYMRVIGGRGHVQAVGTPEQVADTMEQWFVQRGADGFNVMPSHFPGGLEDFVEGVVPILQKRGLFRKEYEGSTLRDHLGLSPPENHFVASTRMRPASVA
jgi:N-acetyl-S-(2-succino)cysteine monooxygenase